LRVSVSNGVALEKAVDRYFFGRLRHSRRFILLTAVADVVAPDILRDVRSRKCPFCGRSFTRSVDLKKHLSITSWRILKVHPHGSDYHYAHDIYPTNPCATLYAMTLKYVVEKYLALRSKLSPTSKTSGRRGNKFRLELPGKPSIYFRSVSELSEYLRKHPNILDEV